MSIEQSFIIHISSDKTGTMGIRSALRDVLRKLSNKKYAMGKVTFNEYPLDGIQKTTLDLISLIEQKIEDTHRGYYDRED